MNEVTVVRGEGEHAREYWFDDVDEETIEKILELLGWEKTERE